MKLYTCVIYVKCILIRCLWGWYMHTWVQMLVKARALGHLELKLQAVMGARVLCKNSTLPSPLSHPSPQPLIIIQCLKICLVKKSLTLLNAYSYLISTQRLKCYKNINVLINYLYRSQWTRMSPTCWIVGLGVLRRGRVVTIFLGGADHCLRTLLNVYRCGAGLQRISNLSWKSLQYRKWNPFIWKSGRCLHLSRVHSKGVLPCSRRNWGSI